MVSIFLILLFSSCGGGATELSVVVSWDENISKWVDVFGSIGVILGWHFGVVQQSRQSVWCLVVVL
jgi:hypothetical protein